MRYRRSVLTLVLLVTGCAGDGSSTTTGAPAVPLYDLTFRVASAIPPREGDDPFPPLEYTYRCQPEGAEDYFTVAFQKLEWSVQNVKSELNRTCRSEDDGTVKGP